MVRRLRAQVEEDLLWVDRAEFKPVLEWVEDLEDEVEVLENRVRRGEQLPPDHPRHLFAKVTVSVLRRTEAQLEQAHRTLEEMYRKDLSLPRPGDGIQESYLRENLARAKSRCFTLVDLVEQSSSAFVRRERERLLSETLAEVRHLTGVLTKLEVGASEPAND